MNRALTFLNICCSVAVEAALLLTFLLAVLAPVSALETRHLVVSQTTEGGNAVVSGDPSGLRAGQSVPLYRFNPDWKSPIGAAKVERVSPGGAVIAVDRGAMRWPLGRHGTITREKDGTWTASIGSQLGFRAGDALTIFRGRTPLGLATIVAVASDSSRIDVPANIGDASGLVVSEYAYATQVAWMPAWVAVVEAFVTGSLLLAYLGLWLYFRRSPFVLTGEILQKIPLPPALAFWAVNLIATPLFAWFMAKMPLGLIVYVAQIISQHTGTTLYLRPLADMVYPYLFALFLAGSYSFLAWTRRSPMLAFWRAISYKRRSREKQVAVGRGLALWALHLIIVYAFGMTLIGFLSADIAAARAIGPHPQSLSELADFWKYVIWSLTVVGVLFGYGYSVVSILWGRFIRNLDFTVQGWLTNGFCYPFLGVVIWQIVPGFTGLDPIIAGGPLELLMLSAGFLLNVLYMLSIWNLGTMFDLMADKGVRTSLFYSVIRHPNYTLEAAMFFVTELVGLSSAMAWLGISVYFFLYWIRSEREDNFMWYSNPAYEPYQQQTPYKFIPGIY